MKKVLVVDDSAFMRAIIKRILLKNGFKDVEEAENGIAAVEKYKQLRPDLVTLDITMPEMSGIEALKLIKEFDPKSKVVMVSAIGQEVFVDEAINLGADAYIVKPFNEKMVMNIINKLLS